MRKHNRRISNSLVILITCIGLAACSLKYTVLKPMEEAPAVEVRDHHVVLVLIDGARGQELDEFAAQGYLPNIQRLFYEDGARFDNAITIFPTLSSPAHQAFTSGLFPGHHGIPSLDWFSRPITLYRDYLGITDMQYTNTLFFNYLQILDGRVYSDAPQLIYHTLKGHPTFTVLEPANFGVTHAIPDSPPLLPMIQVQFGRSYEKVDYAAMKYALTHFREIPQDQLPRFSMINLLSLDLISHFDGPKSSRAKDIYIHYDRFFRELVRVLKQRGIWEKTTLILVSDHGQHALTGVVDLPAMLGRVGLNVNLQNREKGQVVWGAHATGTSQVYLKWGEDWNTRPSYEDIQEYPLKNGELVNLIDRFLEEPDIQLVIAPEGPLKTHFHYKDQHAQVIRKWTGKEFLYAYLPDPGQDPFGYLDNPQIKEWVLKGEFQDKEAWLVETAAEPYPDIVVSVPQAFDDYRNGDLILVTVDEKQFYKQKISAHGSLLREDRVVPILLHGPDIKVGRYPYARTVDLYPTILALLGLKTQLPIDGVVRQEIFKEDYWQEFQKTATYYPRAFNSNNGLTLNQFKIHLEEQLAQPDLDSEKRNKARLLLYTLDQYWADQSTLKSSTQWDKTPVVPKPAVGVLDKRSSIP